MKQNNKKGFTLAELLIVVAIIAVLVAIAIPVFTTQLEKSREATDAANVRAAYATLVTQYLDKGEADSIEVEAQQMKADWQTNPAPKIQTMVDGDMKEVTFDAKVSPNKYKISINKDSGAVTIE